MKKMMLIVLTAMLFVMCKSAKTATAAADAKADTTVEVQYLDDFRAAGDKERNAVLKGLKATAAKYSVLIFTQNFKGEKITATNTKGRLYRGYAISDLKTGIADKTRIDNTVDTTVHDESDKIEVVIEAKEAQKHKFIYLKKNPGSKKAPYTVTYSNTLRPLE
jgi:hypothetical protein